MSRYFTVAQHAGRPVGLRSLHPARVHQPQEPPMPFPYRPEDVLAAVAEDRIYWMYRRSHPRRIGSGDTAGLFGGDRLHQIITAAKDDGLIEVGEDCIEVTAPGDIRESRWPVSLTDAGRRYLRDTLGVAAAREEAVTTLTAAAIRAAGQLEELGATATARDLRDALAGLDAGTAA